MMKYQWRIPLAWWLVEHRMQTRNICGTISDHLPCLVSFWKWFINSHKIFSPTKFSLPKSNPHIKAHHKQPKETNENACVEQITGGCARERNFSEFLIVNLNDRQAGMKNCDADNVGDCAFPMQTAKFMRELVEQKNDDHVRNDDEHIWENKDFNFFWFHHRTASLQIEADPVGWTSKSSWKKRRSRTVSLLRLMQ